MSELAGAMRMLAAKYPTCIQQINFPIYQGKPNPANGKFYFVGSIPAACVDENGRSNKYDTEEQAIRAAIAAGAERIQGVDCRFINLDDYR